MGVAAVTLIAYFWSGCFDHKWWTFDYILSLGIPFSIAPIAVWFMFVPKKLEYSETEFSIGRRFTGSCNLRWSELKYYGDGNNVFMIQFRDRPAYQIFAAAYSRDQWKQLVQFLSDRFPEKKASGYVGPFMFKWRK